MSLVQKKEKSRYGPSLAGCGEEAAGAIRWAL